MTNFSVCPEYLHPLLGKTISKMLQELQKTCTDDCSRVFPIANQFWNFSKKVYIMGILNTTPDSFSDGGDNVDVDVAVGNAIKMAEFADIIDVGGQSTRPGSEIVEEQEEIERVIPVILKIRQLKPEVLISIDTFRSRVAKLALEAGANMINDVSGGKMDPGMLSLMAKTHSSVCLMHMRGTPQTMSSLTDYGPNFTSTLKSELDSIITTALNSGLNRWNILVDFGIGFSKTSAQNFEIIKSIKKLSLFPVLVGVSRKKFVGEVVGKEAKERGWGTAGAVAACVVGGCAVVRVHDCKEMKDVVDVALKTR